MKEKLHVLSERISKLQDNIQTEEATKQAFILPFIEILGYEVFNPLEVVPEFTADVGIKKNEKVDYAILKDNKPEILIEAKACSDKLNKHDSQLFRYFGTTKSKFAILTNGIEYKFYSDLDEPNKMDSQPFFILDMLDISDQDVNYISKFKKSNFDVDEIINSASELKYLNLTKSIFKQLLEEPSDDFIKFILNAGLYEGQKTQKIVDKFRPIIKKGINQHINERLALRFQQTLEDNDDENTDSETEAETVESKIITTLDELNAYAVIKSILRNIIEPSRISYKDTESYFNVLLDNNTRKWLCRIVLDSKKPQIIIPNADKSYQRYYISSIDDIYNYDKELQEVLARYL